MPSSGKRPERNPVLGVSFGHDQIRVVEMRRAGNELTVTAAGSAGMPAGALDPGSTISPELVAQRLKGLLKKMGVTTKHAVLGVPSSGVFTRLLDIPQIPDSELESVVAGEVAHYQMVRQDGGAFGYMRLPTPQNSRDIQVLVMAADDPVLHMLDEVAKRAGLALVSKEPGQLGAVRSIYQTNFSEPTLMISVEDAATEISIVSEGKLMLYRRIDVGGRNLLANTVGLATVGVGGGDVPRAFSPSGGGLVDDVLAARLATEIRRSLEYHRRQFPMSDASQAVLATMDPRLDSLTDYLETALGVPCRVGMPNVKASGAAASELGTPVSSEYFSALGLASGELGYAGDLLPVIDLVPSAPRRTGAIAADPTVIGGVIASAIILVAGFLGYNSLKGQAERAEQETIRQQELGRKLDAELKPKKERQDMEYRVLSDLAKQGTPFPWVMDAVANALDPGVGITEIHFDRGHIRLTAEAKNEAAMVSTLDHIRTQGSFTDPLVDSFQNENLRGLRFNMSSDFIVSSPAIQVQSAPPPVQPQTTLGGGAQ